MQYIIKAPRQLNQTIKLPASKSISNRSLIIHALSGGTLLPDNLSDCDDTAVIIRALRDNPYEIDIMAAGIGSVEGGAVGKLREADEVLLVLAGHEAAGDLAE